MTEGDVDRDARDERPDPDDVATFRELLEAEARLETKIQGLAERLGADERVARLDDAIAVLQRDVSALKRRLDGVAAAAEDEYAALAAVHHVAVERATSLPSERQQRLESWHRTCDTLPTFEVRLGVRELLRELEAAWSYVARIEEEPPRG